MYNACAVLEKVEGSGTLRRVSQAYKPVAAVVLEDMAANELREVPFRDVHISRAIIRFSSNGSSMRLYYQRESRFTLEAENSILGAVRPLVEANQYLIQGVKIKRGQNSVQYRKKWKCGRAELTDLMDYLQMDFSDVTIERIEFEDVRRRRR